MSEAGKYLTCRIPLCEHDNDTIFDLVAAVCLVKWLDNIT